MPSEQPSHLPAIIPGPIQRFVETGLQAQIDLAVRQLEEGDHGAVVGYYRNGHVGLATVARLGDRWSVVIGVDKPKGEGFSKEAAIKFRW